MKVFLASGNSHKFLEFNEMVRHAGLAIEFRAASDVGGMPEVDETGSTFAENALLKARALVGQVPPGSWVLADDSGLVVDALDGAPGIHSARFAGEGSNATANNLKLLRELETVPVDKRSARFRCVLAFMRSDGEVHLFDGICEGRILTQPEGEEGFGYDPLFQPAGFDESFAQLSADEKNRLSHRGRAFREWTAFLKEQLQGDPD